MKGIKKERTPEKDTLHAILSSKLCTEVIEEDVLSWNAQAIEHIHN